MNVETASALIEWEFASHTAPGEVECGDVHVVQPFPGGALAAVIDGLGHGGEAAKAARLAAEVLTKHAGAPVLRIVELCHGALKATRGAVITLASFNYRESTLTALGIGNVEAVLLRGGPEASPRAEPFLLRSGIVGGRMPSLQADIVAVEPGDLVVFSTDGVRPGFEEHVNTGSDLKGVVARIVARGLRGDDDALVLAVRYQRRAFGGYTR